MEYVFGDNFAICTKLGEMVSDDSTDQNDKVRLQLAEVITTWLKELAWDFSQGRQLTSMG